MSQRHDSFYWVLDFFEADYRGNNALLNILLGDLGNQEASFAKVSIWLVGILLDGNFFDGDFLASFSSSIGLEDKQLTKTGMYHTLW